MDRDGQGRNAMTASGPAFGTLVVEDNPAFIAQITAALAHLGRHDVAAFTTGAEALAAVAAASQPLELALIDIGLPDMSGIDVIREIRGRLPDTPILVISFIKSETTLLEAIRAGARGYVLKGEPEEAIAHAIDEVMRGNYPISPALARSLFHLAGAPAGRSQDTDFHLSPRETEVLQHIAKGMSYQEVAAEMGVSLSTVQTYVRGLYRKLQVHNRVAAVNRAREVGVI